MVTIVDSEPLRSNEVFRKIIIVRKTTTTREAITITILQIMNDRKQLTTATITISGKVPTYIESPRFAREYGEALIHAALIAEERNELVNGHIK